MVDFHVVPDALRQNAKDLSDVADAWRTARDRLSDHYMGVDDLGLLGKQANAPSSHNEALNNILDRMARGFEALDNAAKTLKAVADDYESRDAAYYRKFGYLDGQVRR